MNAILKIERIPEVIARTGLSRSSLYALLAKQEFPRPVKLSARAVGFVASEVDEWINRRADRRS